MKIYGKDETAHLNDFLSLARPVVENKLGGVVFRHTSESSRGEPDASLTALGSTLWLEAKLGLNEGDRIIYDSRGRALQCARMLNLATHGLARYLVWCESPNGVTSTHIVHPKDVMPGAMLGHESANSGIRHQWAIGELLRLMRERK